jgi:hypothetical protein
MVLVDELLAVEDYEIDSLDSVSRIQVVEKNVESKKRNRYSLRSSFSGSPNPPQPSHSKASVPSKGDTLGQFAAEMEPKTESSARQRRDGGGVLGEVVEDTVKEAGEEYEREGEQNMFENSKQWLEYFYPVKKSKNEEGLKT